MGIVRLILVILLGYLAYRVVRTVFFKSRLPPAPSRDSIDEMVQDPECNVYVPMQQAEKRVIRGKTYYFCSTRCAEDFEKKNS